MCLPRIPAFGLGQGLKDELRGGTQRDALGVLGPNHTSPSSKWVPCAGKMGLSLREQHFHKFVGGRIP